MNRLLATLLVLCLTGCTSAIRPAIKSINTLEPGVVQTKTIGEPLYEKGILRTAPGFVATANYYLPQMDNLVFPTVKKGSTWVCGGFLDDGDYLCANPDITRNDVLTGTGKPVTTELPLFIIKPWGEFHGLYYADGGRIVEQENRLHGLFLTTEVLLNDSHRTQVIYGGRNGTTIRLTYQEFVGNEKMPSVSEELKYEVTSANIINVKNVLVEVMDATESQIKYVIKN